MKLTKTSKIGILVIISLTLLIWGMNFLKGRDIFRTEKLYYARYENVGGLTATTLVTLNGLKVGYVREIYFAEDLSGDLIVRIAIHNDFPLPVGTTAEIVSTDLLGSKVVRLNLGDSEQLVQANDTLPTLMAADLMQQVNEQIEPIKQKAERMIENLDSIVMAVSRILDSDTQHNLTKSLQQISQTMTNLEKITGNVNDVVYDQKKNLASTISNLNAATENLKSNSGKLGRIMDNFATFSDSLTTLELNQTVAQMNGSLADLQGILTKIDTANGSLGLLVNDRGLYQNLSSSTENLNRLLIDLRLNPKRYVHFSAFDFGRNQNLITPASSPSPDHITFRVHIFSSETPLSVNSPLFKGIQEVTEIRDGRKYEYMTAPETYDQVRMTLNKVQSAFPEAVLKSYENGREISLKNALKSMRK